MAEKGALAGSEKYDRDRIDPSPDSKGEKHRFIIDGIEPCSARGIERQNDIAIRQARVDCRKHDAKRIQKEPEVFLLNRKRCIVHGAVEPFRAATE